MYFPPQDGLILRDKGEERRVQSLLPCTEEPG